MDLGESGEVAEILSRGEQSLLSSRSPFSLRNGPFVVWKLSIVICSFLSVFYSLSDFL